MVTKRNGFWNNTNTPFSPAPVCAARMSVWRRDPQETRGCRNGGSGPCGQHRSTRRETVMIAGARATLYPGEPRENSIQTCPSVARGGSSHACGQWPAGGPGTREAQTYLGHTWETPAGDTWKAHLDTFLLRSRGNWDRGEGTRGTDDWASQVQKLFDALQVREQGREGLRKPSGLRRHRADVVGLLCSPTPLGAGRHLVAHTCANKPWPVVP